MKFSSIIKGTKARKTIELSLVGVDEPVKIGIRVLRADEEADTIANATSYAKSKGSDAAAPGDPLFDLALWANRAAIGCIDPDSPAESPQPYFDNVEQILSSELLTGEHLAYLNDLQEVWQDEHSPYEKDCSNDEMLRRIAKIGSGDSGPFFALRPGMRWSLVHFLALQHVASLVLRSQLGSTSQESSSPESEPIQ